MDSRAINSAIAIFTVLSIVLALIALVSQNMTKSTLGPSTVQVGLWKWCVSLDGATSPFPGNDNPFKGDQVCGLLKDDAKHSQNVNLLQVAGPIATISMLVVFVAMLLALLGMQTSKKGMYILLVILLALGAAGSWVVVALVGVYKDKNTNASFSSSWYMYLVAAGLASLGALCSGLGVHSSGSDTSSTSSTSDTSTFN